MGQHFLVLGMAGLEQHKVIALGEGLGFDFLAQVRRVAADMHFDVLELGAGEDFFELFLHFAS